MNTITKDKVKNVLAAIKKLAESKVLVGIPAETAPRKGEPMNNAALGFIHEYGAPEANIPARPFLIPGVRDAQAKIASALRRGAKKALGKAVTGDTSAAVGDAMEAAGIAAASAVRRKITQGAFAPLSPNTRRARDRKAMRRAKSKKNGRGEAIDAAQAALGDRHPLIDTSELRKSITYVVK